MMMSSWYRTIDFYEFESLYDPSYLNLDINDMESWNIYAQKVRSIISKVLEIPCKDFSVIDMRDFGEIYLQ